MAERGTNRGMRILKGTGYGLWMVAKYSWLTVWTLYQIALGAVLVGLVYGVYMLGDYFSLWDIRKLQTGNPSNTAFIESERVRLTDSLRMAGIWPPPDTLIRWQWVPFDSIPPVVKELTLVAEDAKFYEHQGFDLEQIEYAMVANHQSGKKARGASTITQQVAKNLYLTKDKELSRKAKEAAIALLLENYLSKDRILEIYLNIAQFDVGVFGIRAAARHHYGKDVTELTQEEAVNVVTLLPSPTKWDYRKPNNAYLQHKRLVIRNYALFKGIKNDLDSTRSDWLDSAYSSLADNLSEDRWKQLRSRPNFLIPGDSASPDSSRPATAENDAGRGIPARTF
jgi:monofunctional biosynthetic peptidoglycan transglycosylase